MAEGSWSSDSRRNEWGRSVSETSFSIEMAAHTAATESEEEGYFMVKVGNLGEKQTVGLSLVVVAVALEEERGK